MREGFEPSVPDKEYNALASVEGTTNSGRPSDLSGLLSSQVGGVQVLQDREISKSKRKLSNETLLRTDPSN